MTDHDYGDIFEWGLKDGNIVHVDNVENGEKCNCFCSDCGTPLVAFNKKGNKRANHFQHKSKGTCRNAYESALHFIAKEIIQDTKKLIVPDVSYILPTQAQDYFDYRGTSRKDINKKELQFDKVEVEKQADYFRPDLKCYIGEKVLYIEIAVTHFVDTEKRKKIQEHNIPLLEIDLSKFDRATHKEKLTEILHGQIEYMKWVYNPKIDERHQEVETRGKIVKEFINKNRKEYKVYGKEQYIYNCPIYKQYYKTIKVEEECKYCDYYIDEYEGLYEMGDEPPKFPDVTLECIGHKASEYYKLLKSIGIKIKD